MRKTLKHDKKMKGDIGLTRVIADLTEHGFFPCLPLSEHLSFDLVVADQSGRLSRIQVKYRAMRDGVIPLKLASSYSSKKGTYEVAHNLDYFDAYAIYCPDTDKIYYIPTSEIRPGQTEFKVRVVPPKQKGKQRTIHYARDYTDRAVIFRGGD